MKTVDQTDGRFAAMRRLAAVRTNVIESLVSPSAEDERLAGVIQVAVSRRVPMTQFRRDAIETLNKGEDGSRVVAHRQDVKWSRTVTVVMSDDRLVIVRLLLLNG